MTDETSLELARRLIDEGDAQLEEGRHDDAIATLRAIVERFEGDPSVHEQVARALVLIGFTLDTSERHAEAIDVYDDVVARFGDASEPDLLRRVTRALCNKAGDLLELGRPEEALETCDDVVSRLEARDDPVLAEPLADALLRRAIALEDLERADEAIAAYEAVWTQFGDADDPELRETVGWALGRASALLFERERFDELSRVAERLSVRGDDELEPELAGYVAWAMAHRADELRDVGDLDGELDWLGRLVARFGESSDGDVQIRVATALVRKGVALEELGRHDEALASLDDVVARHADAASPELRRQVSVAFWTKAASLERRGRADEALAAYDATLACLAEETAATAREDVVGALLDKGNALRRFDREEEAIVVLDSSIAACGELARTGAEGMTRPLAWAVEAAIAKLDALCALGRTEHTAVVPEQLTDVLGPPDAAPPPPLVLAPGSEERLAALLAEVHRSQWWTAFEQTAHDAAMREWMAGRALELYRETAPWFAADPTNGDSPWFVAFTMLRLVAAGYALQSGEWTSPKERRTMPVRGLLEFAFRDSGVDEWAAELGHPLDLDEPLEDPYEQLHERARLTESETALERLAPALVSALRTYELLELLCDSELGREALAGDELRSAASRELSGAMGWTGWTALHADDAELAGFAILLVAEAFWLATRGEFASSAAIVPSREHLSAFLHRTDAYDWLADREVTLPDWIEGDDA